MYNNMYMLFICNCTNIKYYNKNENRKYPIEYRLHYVTYTASKKYIDKKL